jgi:hypothetical protein
MPFIKHEELLVLSYKPSDGISILDWCPFGNNVKLDDIVTEYNKKCFERYKELWKHENFVESLPGIKVILRDLSNVTTLKPDDFKRIRFLLIDLDEIGKNLGIEEKLDYVRRSLDQKGVACFFIQVSKKSGAASCPVQFRPTYFMPSVPDIINNIEIFKNFLSYYCNIIGMHANEYQEPLPNSSIREKQITQKYIEDIPKLLSESIDDFIKRKLSQEEALKLSRSKAEKAFAGTTMFTKAMETKYTKEWGSNKVGSSGNVSITSKKTKYLRLGYQQSPRKVEMAKCGAAITSKRKLQAYDPKMHLGGIPMGQRQLHPYTISGTNIVCDGDDLHFVNNAAMQQMWDDIRRTCVVGLDLAHETIEKRLGKEVTPETINYYLEVLNHAMPGAAIVQEHMVETHPALVDDCYVKVFTGDESLQDELDQQFIINIDKEFPSNQANQIKASIGKTSWQAVHIPTIVN